MGGKDETESDFRLVAATNRDLQGMVEGGLFREDLLFRLKSFIIKLPPLRDRKEDIKELVIHHMSKLCERYGTGLKGYSPEFMEALIVYPWPGNVRELFHALECAAAAARFEATLFIKHLPDEIRIHFTKAALGNRASDSGPSGNESDAYRRIPSFKDHKTSVERQYLEDLMTFSGGNIKEACEISGLSRSYLYELLKDYGIAPLQRQFSR